MATLTFSFETGGVPLTRIIDAFATAYSYSATLNDGTTPNPETKAQFAKRMVRDFIINTVRSQEVVAAQATVVKIDLT